MKFGPVTSEIKRVVGVHPSLITRLVTFAWRPTAIPCRIITEFCGTISAQFCFTYSLGGITAMPRGLCTRISSLCMLLVAVARSSSDGVAVNVPFCGCPISGDRTRQAQQPIFATNFCSTIKTGSTRCELRTGGEVSCLPLPCLLWRFCCRKTHITKVTVLSIQYELLLLRVREGFPVMCSQRVFSSAD